MLFLFFYCWEEERSCSLDWICSFLTSSASNFPFFCCTHRLTHFVPPSELIIAACCCYHHLSLSLSALLVLPYGSCSLLTNDAIDQHMHSACTIGIPSPSVFRSEDIRLVDGNQSETMLMYRFLFSFLLSRDRKQSEIYIDKGESFSSASACLSLVSLSIHLLIIIRRTNHW